MKVQKSVTFVKRIENKYLKDKKYWIIVIIQGNIEALRIAYVIENFVYLKKFL